MSILSPYMEGERGTPAWKIFLYLTPVYVLAAIPLYKRYQQLHSPDVAGASAFSGEESPAPRRPAGDGYDPGLTDSGLTINYRAGGEADGSLPGDRELPSSGKSSYREEPGEPQRQGKQRGPGGGGEPYSGGSRFAKNPAQAALVSDATKAKEQAAVGYKRGLLTETVGELMKHPKAVGALLNNKYVVEGFMARPNVKAATGSADGLASYLRGSGPANFLNNPVVKAALNNPAVVSAVAGSGMVSAMLNTPAARELMKDPDKLAALVDSNPQLVQLAMQNPQTLSLLMSNPDVAAQVAKFDTSKIRKY